jgi:hypothetical protein
MMPGPDFDRVIAEKFLSFPSAEKHPPYSTSLSTAKALRKKLIDLGIHEISIMRSGRWKAVDRDGKTLFTFEAEHTAHALCLVALKTMGG